MSRIFMVYIIFCGRRHFLSLQGENWIFLYEPGLEKNCLPSCTTRQGLDWPAQIQKLARLLEFRMKQL